MPEDTRNVIDQYKSWTNDLIKQDLKTKMFPYAVLMTHIKGDFNIGTVIRSANAFGAEQVFYYGQRHIDRRGALGCYHYTGVQHLRTMEEIIALKNEYTFVGLENVERAVSMHDFEWPKRPLILIGEEACGLSEEFLDLCDHVVQIFMCGSVRSLNAATAGSIAMHDFVAKNLNDSTT